MDRNAQIDKSYTGAKNIEIDTCKFLKFYSPLQFINHLIREFV